MGTFKLGTYDSNDVFQQQKVSLGITSTGTRGYFTDGFLASYPISKEAYEKDDAYHGAVCDTLGFIFVPKQSKLIK